MIIIEGTVGVGKSTLQKKICEKIDKSYMLVQDFEHNICLKDFYDGYSCILQKQMIFLFSDYHILSTALKKYPEKIIVSDYSLERSAIMAKNYLTDYEYKNLFLPCYNYLIDQIHIPRKMLIMLYASPEYIKENIKKRNRTMEQEIQLQYIRDKQELLMKGMLRCSFEKVISINCEHEDILNKDIIERLLEEIKSFENVIK